MVLLVLLSTQFYLFLAKLVAICHLSYVLFVFLGLFYIYIGKVLKLKSVSNIYFRVIHLLAMIIVAIQQYYMINCPLTILEKKLLVLAGKEIYSGAFVAHLFSMIDLNIPTSYYLPLYISLSILFLISFIIVPPKRNKALHKV